MMHDWCTSMMRATHQQRCCAQMELSWIVYRETMSLFQLVGKYLLEAEYSSGGGTWKGHHST